MLKNTFLHIPGLGSKERLLTRFELSEAMKKDLPDLEIPEDLLNRIIEHARQEYPLESCGILAGKNGKISRFYPLGNKELDGGYSFRSGGYFYHQIGPVY